MPEVVNYWHNSHDEILNTRRLRVKEIQTNILSNYQNDFGKYAGEVNSLHIQEVFQNISIQVQNNFEGSAKRYISSGSGFGSTYGDVQELIEAIVEWGHEIEGHDNNSASKPLLASRPWAVFTLRRTPPTIYTPQASGDPVLRIPYIWMINRDNNDDSLYYFQWLINQTQKTKPSGT